jgi:hypothetical protein
MQGIYILNVGTLMLVAEESKLFVFRVFRCIFTLAEPFQPG